MQRTFWDGPYSQGGTRRQSQEIGLIQASQCQIARIQTDFPLIVMTVGQDQAGIRIVVDEEAAHTWRRVKGVRIDAYLARDSQVSVSIEARDVRAGPVALPIK